MPVGKPLAPGGEVVRLEQRPDSKALYDVHVDYKVPDESPPSSRSGPPQVATPAYRASWDRTFGVN